MLHPSDVSVLQDRVDYLHGVSHLLDVQLETINELRLVAPSSELSLDALADLEIALSTAHTYALELSRPINIG